MGGRVPIPKTLAIKKSPLITLKSPPPPSQKNHIITPFLIFELGVPKRGGWGGESAIWEKFPNNPVIFFECVSKVFLPFYAKSVLHTQR